MELELTEALVVKVCKALAVMERAGASPASPASPPVAVEGHVPVQMNVAIRKADVDLELGVIYGTASSLSKDRQGDYVVNRKELDKAAVTFMANANKRATRTHKATLPGVWVASWVHDDDTWTVGFKPDDLEVARAAARGEFVGFSIGGDAEEVAV